MINEHPAGQAATPTSRSPCGSDYPTITRDRWLADLNKLQNRDKVRPLIPKANAARTVGLTS